MRIERLLEILVVVLFVAAASCVVIDAPSVEEVATLFSELPVGLASAGPLILLAATAGLVNVVILRRQSRDLANTASHAIARGKVCYIEPPSNALSAVVGAMNESFAMAERAIAQSASQAKQLEIELKVANGQRQQAQAIIHSINDAVLVTNAFDEVMMANEAARRMLGIDPDQAKRIPIEQVVADPQVAQQIKDVRNAGSASERRMIEHRMRIAGKDRFFKLTLSAIPDAAGTSAGVVAVLSDMTRERELARMKNDFVSSVSHELRTPLASIRAYVEMLIDGEATDDKSRHDFYEIIQNEAVRLGRLIDNVLNISRIESGLVEIKKQPLSLTVICKEALDVVTSQAKSKNIRIEEQLEPAIHQVNADREMIYQSVMNLLSNAIKYTRDGGTVTVRSRVDETTRRISVRVIDTGVGIPAKDIPFVFDKFFRVEANKHVAKGTGLGLSLVKNIVETVHKGRVFAESEVGRGSCFGFELDLC